MKIGIIAEYNPFHNGHKYQLDYIREHFSPEGIFIAMSGNFVQRGEPAAFDKYVRAEAALKNGADAVFELPQMYALSSAQGFAASGIKLLSAVGCDAVCCGAEDPGYDRLPDLIDILEKEPDEFREVLRRGMSKGLTFPEARTRAFAFLLPDAGVADFLCKPNNLLAFEYHFAARSYAPDMRIIMLPRKDAGHGDSFATGSFAPASYLRTLLAKGDRESLAGFYSLVPDSAKPLYNTADFVELSDFDAIMFDRLICYADKMRHIDSLSQSDRSRLMPYGHNPDLSNRIVNHLSDYRGTEAFTELLKTKNITYTAARRALMQILIDSCERDFECEEHYLPYIRLLGRKKGAAQLLSSITLSLSAKGRGIIMSLPQDPPPILLRHIKNDMLYEGIRALKSGTSVQNEYKRRLLSVK